ncbi:MAG: HEPN domain-containing protein [Candidatus Nanohaloarchaea archaeon]
MSDSDTSVLNQQDLKYCRNQLRKAKKKRRSAEEALEDSTPAPSYSNVISDCQQCIELSGKILFRLVGEHPPEQHDISFESGQKVLRAEFPDSFGSESNLPRVIFLTQFWNEFYLPAKYGEENYGIAPDNLFRKEEAELAVSHAKFCFNAVSDLFHSVQYEQRNR